MPLHYDPAAEKTAARADETDRCIGCYKVATQNCVETPIGDMPLCHKCAVLVQNGRFCRVTYGGRYNKHMDCMEALMGLGAELRDMGLD